ncbi:MAG: branched-chain amino acid transport system II carrier protein, partial [Pseudomonadota bacterium]
LGHNFAIIFAALVFLACVTTAIAAITVWSDFIILYFPKFNYKAVLIVSLTISYFVSLSGFSSLMKLLGPVLNVTYPILICLTIYNIFIYYKPKKVISQSSESLLKSKN